MLITSPKASRHAHATLTAPVRHALDRGCKVSKRFTQRLEVSETPRHLGTSDCLPASQEHIKPLQTNPLKSVASEVPSITVLIQKIQKG